MQLVATRTRKAANRVHLGLAEGKFPELTLCGVRAFGHVPAEHPFERATCKRCRHSARRLRLTGTGR